MLFDVSTYADYGQLSQQNLEMLQAGARVEVDQAKDDPLDFVLWKMAKPGEPSWESPWGAGRPGWHIECSAMSAKHLGNHFDIHGGGSDLQFPHHENEIAQSCCAHGTRYVNTWIHTGMVQVDKEKMSKSLGNFFTVKDVLAQIQPGISALFPDFKPLSQPTELFSRKPATGPRCVRTALHGVTWNYSGDNGCVG